MNTDGSDPQKLIDNGSWASWVSAGEIVFVRGTTILKRDLGSGQ